MQKMIPCYDPYAQHKLIGVLLTGLALLGLAVFLLQPMQSAPSAMQQLPRVTVVGQSDRGAERLSGESAQQLLASEPTAAGRAAPVQLPRVIIEGRRSPATLASAELEGRQLAQGLPAAAAGN